MHRILLLLVPFFSAFTGFSQQTTLNGQSYEVHNRRISAGADAASLLLDERDGPGIAWIGGRAFRYGVIELDVRGCDKLQGSFVGMAFHGTNDSTYEAIYFRPFNFNSSDPVRKSHSVQYISNPKHDWPLLRSDFPNKYEQAVLPPPDPNKWFHVRIEVTVKEIAVFVNGNSKPSLRVEPLEPPVGNKIGYWVGNGSAGDWKNIRITESGKK